MAPRGLVPINLGSPGPYGAHPPSSLRGRRSAPFPELEGIAFSCY
jgi:hypothetical protein